jgi:hypothetical protein
VSAQAGFVISRRLLPRSIVLTLYFWETEFGENMRLVFSGSFQMFYPLFETFHLLFDDLKLNIESFMKFDESIVVVVNLV